MTEFDQPPQKPPKEPMIVASWARQYVTVVEFVGMLAVLGYAGYWLDQKYGWQPWGILSGLLLALVAGVHRMIREGRRLEK